MTIDELNDFVEKHGFFNVNNTEPIKKEYVADLVEDALTESYNKAIDDFKEELFKNSERARPVGWLGYSEIVTCEKIYDIAEKLKKGEENGR